MSKPIIVGLKPFPMFVFTSLCVLIVGILFQFVAFLSGAFIFNIPLKELLSIDSLDTQAIINAVKYIQIIGGIGTFIFTSLFLSYLYTGDWLGYFSARHFPEIASIILLLAIMLSGLPFVNYLTELNMKMTIPFEKLEELLRSLEEQTENMMMKLIETDNIGGLMLNLLMIAIIPSIGEELLFRGLMQRHLAESFRNVHIAIIVTAIIFSLVHFQPYSFLPRFFLGIVLGYIFVMGKSIWYPIIAHFVNNAVGVIFYYMLFQQKTTDSLEEIGTSESLPIMAILSLIAVVAFMVLLVMRVKQLRPVQSGKDSIL